MAVTVVFGDVKVRYLTDDWPAGVNDANVTALCAKAEIWIQNKSQGTQDLSSAGFVELSVDLVVNWIEYAKYIHEGQAAGGIQRPVIWSRDMEDRYQVLLMGTEDQSRVEDTIDFRVT